MSTFRSSSPILIALILLQGADIITTNLLSNFEINPVVLFMFGQLGAIWWLPKLAIVGAIVLAFFYARRIPRRSLVAVTGLYSAVVAWNILNVVAVYMFNGPAIS